MRCVSYQRKVGDQFFPEPLAYILFLLTVTPNEYTNDTDSKISYTTYI
jgi:hypothetical protein